MSVESARLAQWLSEYARILIRQHPQEAGRIDWSAAKILYNKELTPTQAVERS